VLHLILISLPRHTYSSPAGSNNCSEMAEKVRNDNYRLTSFFYFF
jgi:hypothetical protein